MHPKLHTQTHTPVIHTCTPYCTHTHSMPQLCHQHSICPVLGEYYQLICDGAGATCTILYTTARTLICRFIIPFGSFHINHLSGQQPLSLHWMHLFVSNKWHRAKHVTVSRWRYTINTCFCYIIKKCSLFYIYIIYIFTLFSVYKMKLKLKCASFKDEK